MSETTPQQAGKQDQAVIEDMIPWPRTIEETELSVSFLADLALKFIYYSSDMTSTAIAKELALPFRGVMEKVLDFLKREEYVEISGAKGFGERGYQWIISSKGVERALQALERDQYIGPAPVPFERYCEMVLKQSVGDIKVGPADVRSALSHLVVGPELVNKIGPAVNSGRSFFLYGPPGNGKTVVAKSIVRMLKGYVYIPYTVIVDGQIIRLYDELNHKLFEEPQDEAANESTNRVGMKRIDTRWIKIWRPEIVVGGELTMRNLDLIYDPISKTYEAPLQMKANTGLFVIDDFGRQAMRPQDLLNRWIVPLEMRIDFLTLQTGKKVEVPFDQLIVFSTNLDPRDLVDEAFLRRIRHKLMIGNPDEKQYYQIMQKECAAHRMELSRDAFVHLMQKHYIDEERTMRCCHPRDLVDQIHDISSFLGVQPVLSNELIDAACDGYFADL
jgi:predicted ATPase with chaperone activity